MPYVVFAQRAEATLDLVGISRSASRWFQASIEVIDEQRVPPLPATPDSSTTRLILEKSKEQLRAGFKVHARRISPDDLGHAQEAETRGRASGMASLAARCSTLWEIEPDAGVSERALLILAAIFAVTALGPVMPPDRSTLFGVRGAMERAEKLQNA